MQRLRYSVSDCHYANFKPGSFITISGTNLASSSKADQLSGSDGSGRFLRGFRQCCRATFEVGPTRFRANSKHRPRRLQRGSGSLFGHRPIQCPNRRNGSEAIAKAPFQKCRLEYTRVRPVLRDLQSDGEYDLFRTRRRCPWSSCPQTGRRGVLRRVVGVQNRPSHALFSDALELSSCAFGRRFHQPHPELLPFALIVYGSQLSRNLRYGRKSLPMPIANKYHPPRTTTLAGIRMQPRPLRWYLSESTISFSREDNPIE